MKAKILGVIVLTIILVGGYYIVRSYGENSSQDNTNQTQSQDATNEPGVIIFDGASFSPQTLTVQSGETVTIRNTSSQVLEFDSDPHPAHTDNTELNVGVVRPGESQTFTVDRVGTYGYHDHLDSRISAELIVE